MCPSSNDLQRTHLQFRVQVKEGEERREGGGKREERMRVRRRGGSVFSRLHVITRNLPFDLKHLHVYTVYTTKTNTLWFAWLAIYIMRYYRHTEWMSNSQMFSFPLNHNTFKCVQVLRFEYTRFTSLNINLLYICSWTYIRLLNLSYTYIVVIISHLHDCIGLLDMCYALLS